MYGEVIKTFTTFTPTNFISLSGNLPGGAYFVELTQGKNKKIVKLIKME